MSDYSKLKELAEALEVATSQYMDDETNNALGDEWSLANDRYVEASDPAVVLGLIAENGRLLKLLTRVVDQHVPLTELEGVPGWSRVVELVEVTAQRDALKAECEGLRKHAPSTEITWCACGDGHAASSYGAGFMDANGGVCENCDAAQPRISCPLELFEGLRDSAAEEAAQHKQAMGSYRPHRQEALDAVVRQCDELIAGASKEASNG
jgi:hypothetical protein